MPDTGDAIMGTDWTFWLAVGTAALWLAGFAWVLLRRGCAGLRNGATVEVTLALVTAGVVTALGLGAWAYHQSRAIVADQLVRSLDNVGRTAEGELAGEVRVTMSNLTNLATPELFELARTNPEAARERLEWLENFNHRFLQINVIDDRGNVLLATTRDHGAVTDAGEPRRGGVRDRRQALRVRPLQVGRVRPPHPVHERARASATSRQTLGR